MKPRFLVGAEERFHPGDLHHLAAEAHKDGRADIRVGCVTPERALQILPAGAFGGHAAARSVKKRHHVIDVGIVVEHSGGADVFRRPPDHRRRTVHRRHQRDHVAGADAAIGAVVALEFARIGRGYGRLGAGEVLSRRDRAFVRGEAQVVRVDMRTFFDGGGGEADELAKFLDGLARLYRVARQFVTGGDTGVTDVRRLGKDRHVVGGIEDHRACHATYSTTAARAPFCTSVS